MLKQDFDPIQTGFRPKSDSIQSIQTTQTLSRPNSNKIRFGWRLNRDCFQDEYKQDSDCIHLYVSTEMRAGQACVAGSLSAPRNPAAQTYFPLHRSRRLRRHGLVAPCLLIYPSVTWHLAVSGANRFQPQRLAPVIRASVQHVELVLSVELNVNLNTL